jgi:lipopolysaccharide transport system ATP-binding protein
MSDVAITAENLSKCYVVGRRSAERERYTTLRDVIAREARNFGRNASNFVRGRQIVQGDELEEFWALHDVSFEVKRGQVFGIIGRNGAGKSTLLKILSRITEPDRGRAILHGRIASLLEVGTGFHPELTGRENIFLNGAILGMSRAETKCKLDEIVEFAEVERFLDTPVKRYSSGMYMRLAFAVAAHLEPEILIVDEVLAVGDAKFQRKCLGKMRDVTSRQGRTVLLVSHNMAAIEAMCGSALLLAEGRCIASGSTASVVQAYLRGMGGGSRLSFSEAKIKRSGSGDVRFISFSLEGPGGVEVGAFQCGIDASLHFVLENRTDLTVNKFTVAFGFDNEMGTRVALLGSEMTGVSLPALPPGRESLRVAIPKMPLMPGRYTVTVFATINGEITDWITSGFAFDVEAGDFYGTGRLPSSQEGMFLLEHAFLCGEDGGHLKPSGHVDADGY